MVKVFGVTGWKNSGKTTLLTRLVGLFSVQGLLVSTLKHAHHSVDIDLEGKDSHRHRLAGAREVVISSASRWALMHESHGDDEASLIQLLARLTPVDLVLVEGFKHDAHPKLQVIRSEIGAEPLAPEGENVVAYATDVLAALPAYTVGKPVFDLDDVPAIAAFVLAAAAPVSPRPESGKPRSR